MLLSYVVAPEIIIPPVDVIVINGNEAVLNCAVVSDPLPSVSWFISGIDISLLLSDGIMIPFNQEGRIDDSVVTNTIINSTVIHSSLSLMEIASFIAGDYTCRASNILGKITRTATLIVHGMLTS